VVRHNFELDDLGSEFLRRLEQDCFQAYTHVVHEHRPAILGTPNDADSANPVVLARVHEVMVASEWNICSHISTIPAKRVWHKTHLESATRRFLPRPEGRGIRAGDLVIVLGLVVALGQVNFDVTGFVAGLGIAGFAIGFALQDIARNFVAGILLLVRQPFNVGDAVEVGDYAGTVLEITTRDTVLKTWDGEMVIVPNMDVFTNAIKNYSQLPLRRCTVNIGLGYDEDVDQATGVFLEAVRGVAGVQDDPAPEVLAENPGDSALMLAARFWVNQQTHGLFVVHSQVVQAIKEPAEREGIDLPYPVQTVRLEGGWPGGSQ
jgi:small conductance mechanosensitive channel